MLSTWSIIRRKLRASITAILVACIISGCISSTQQEYENIDVGIKLEKPKNWDLEYYERSSVIVLQAENKVRAIDTARVEIHGNACVPTPAWFKGHHEEIRTNIDRIRVLYNLDNVAIIQEPISIENGRNKVTKAIVAVPTMALPENSLENQIGARDPGLFQTIAIFAVQDENYMVMAYIYEGNSTELNKEAEDIIASIQLTCSN